MKRRKTENEAKDNETHSTDDRPTKTKNMQNEMVSVLAGFSHESEVHCFLPSFFISSFPSSFCRFFTFACPRTF